MNNDYEKLFASFEEQEPPAGLTEHVLARIERRERRILGVKIAASAVTFGASIGVAVAGYINLVASLSRSGFFEIASLMFSDFSSMAANFPDFALSMIESFPAFTAALLLSGVLFAIWSMAALIDETSLMRHGRFFISH
ncbi:MAG TPA: hypothetical protein VMA75_03115 [Candidatus Paceibacterota bacterium]|nr:hypothetical protein [Candidatus Paceibacterota bacterium]